MDSRKKENLKEKRKNTRKRIGRTCYKSKK